jgi:two-component system phosphate regulon sensor histidine kinase PhoR
MFLSKKWIIIIIAVTGMAFLVLLFIQYGWTRKSIEINRRHFTDRMLLSTNNIRRAFLKDKVFQATYLSDRDDDQELFESKDPRQGLESSIKHKLDSVLKADEMPQSQVLSGRVRGSGFCYLMNFIPADQHSDKIDRSEYKICLCNNAYPAALDIGFNLQPNKMLGSDSSGLILPSVILILLLIALFAYIIFVINRQKILAELKNDFINNLTHEFNTPLFSIGLTSNLLLRSEAVHQSDKLKGYVELISTEKNRIQTQVDKILSLTAIESGNLILEKEAVDIYQVINENVAGFATVIEEKGGSISFKPGARNHFVEGDKVHLFNALSNLLDNAYKYSDKIPEIVIETSNINGELVISVTDKGIGMTKTELGMIFNKFYRVKHGDRHDVKGFGLGLSYVRKIIELHGGRVEVKSKPGTGSTFTLYIPGSY